MDKDILRELARLKLENPERHRERLLELTATLQKKIEVGKSLDKIEVIVYEAGERIKKELILKEEAERELIIKKKPRRRVEEDATRERLEEEIPYEAKKAEIMEWLTPYVCYHPDELNEAQDRIAKERFGIPFADLSDNATKEVRRELVREGTIWLRFPDLESALWGRVGFGMYKPSPNNYWWVWENDPEEFERRWGEWDAPACRLYRNIKIDKTLTYGEIKRATGIPSFVIDAYMDTCRLAIESLKDPYYGSR